MRQMNCSIHVLSAMLILCMGIAACSRATPQPIPSAQTPPVSEEGHESNESDPATQNTLTFGGDFSSIRSLDPAVVYEIDGFLAVGNIYQTLVTFNPTTPDTPVKPALAKQWDIQDTGTTWAITFTLNEQAQFASGRPVTSNDVIFSWSRAIEMNMPPAFLLTDIARMSPKTMQAIDAHTVAITIPKEVNPNIVLSILSFTVAAVLDKDAVEANAGNDHGSGWLNEHSAGSGPYTLERWDRNDRIILSANPSYWREAPAIPRIIMRQIFTMPNLQAMLESGNVDIVQEPGTLQAQALADNPDIEVVKATSLDIVYIGMNVSKPPLNNGKVREAIRYAINYEELVHNLLQDNAQLVQEIIPAGLPGHTGKILFQHDSEHARALLAQAGVDDGTELEILIPPDIAPGGVEWNIIAAKLQSDLQQVGLTLEVRQTPDLLDRYRAQNAQMVMTAWSPDFFDPDANISPFTSYADGTIAWRNAWDAPDIAALAQQAATEQNMQQRIALYQTLTERIAHEGPYVVLYQPQRTFGIHAHVRGFTYTPSDIPAIRFEHLRFAE